MAEPFAIYTCAEHVRRWAAQSVCKRRGVACMVVDIESSDLIGWGVNGPAGFNAERCSGIKDGCGCAHSELNTLLACHPTKKQRRDRLGWMVTTRAPCVPCATAIINSGWIRKLTYLDESEPGAGGLALLQECGITVERFDDGKDQHGLKSSAKDAEGVRPCPKCGHNMPANFICPMCGA